MLSLRRRGAKTKAVRTGAWIIAGLVLIVVGLAILGYEGYQRAMVRYHQDRLRKAYLESIRLNTGDATGSYERVVISDWHEMRIIIPKIDVDLQVQKGDVFDMSGLHNKGPVHFGETTDPETGEVILVSPLPSTGPGNVAIAGHRGARWGFFTDLDSLEEGDEIYLDIAGYRFVYLVEWSRIVDPHDWSLLHATGYPAVTLQTCEPKHSSATHRLIVRGALSEVTRVPQLQD